MIPLVHAWRERLARVPSATIKEFGVIVSGQILAAAGGFVGFRLLSGHITTATWGDVLLWQTFALLANQVIVAGLAGAASRHAIMAHQAGEMIALLVGIVLLMLTAFTTIALVTGVLALTGIIPSLMESPGTLLMVALLGLAAGLTSIGDSIQNAFRQRKVVAMHQAAGQWLRFLLAIAFVAWLGATARSVLTGFVMGSGLVLISQVGFARRLFKELGAVAPAMPLRHVGKWCLEVLHYGWPFAAWGILNWLQTSTERWAIESALSSSEVGVYGAAAQLSVQPMTMFWGALMQLMTPIIFRTADIEANPARARRLILATACLTFGIGSLMAVIIQCFGSKFAGWFVAVHFHEMTRYWPTMMLVAGLSGAGQVLSAAAMVFKRTDLMIFPRLAAGSIGIALTILLVPRFGISGAVLSSGVSAVILCGMNGRLFFRLSHAI